jgi:hypothetical protein
MKSKYFLIRESDMNTISILKRTLQALAITGISIFALSPVIAGDKPKLILQITVDQFRGDLPSAQGQALAEEKIAGVAVYCVTPANIFNVMG